MKDFDAIKEKIDTLSEEIERAKFETEFARTGERKEELKIKPIYLVFLLITAFFVELATSIINRKFEPTIWLYCVVGAILLIYGVYFAIHMTKRSKNKKETECMYESKRAVYESLLERRKEIFEQYVSQTNGIIMISAENNVKNYVWAEEDVMVVCTLEKRLEKTEIKLDDINYISSDERLFDYNKILGNSTTVSNEMQNAYIFTREKCFVFHTLNYNRLVELMPEKELLNVLKSQRKEE